MGKKSKAQEAEMKRQYQEERRRKELEKKKKQNKLMWQIVICVVAAVLLITAVIVAIALGGKKEITPTKLDGYINSEEITDLVRMNVTYTDKNGKKTTGDIVVKLLPDVAPITVENFQNLVDADFYNGLTFHRIDYGFMIQGGDPDGDGTGGTTTIKGEMTNNGFQNDLSHERGVISMARRPYNYDSASCQFFIMHEDTPSLDGEYASFGSVVYGLDTVDGIAGTKVGGAQNTTPVNPVTINYMNFVTPEAE